MIHLKKWEFIFIMGGFSLFSTGFARLVVYWYPPEFIFAKELSFGVAGFLMIFSVWLSLFLRSRKVRA